MSHNVRYEFFGGDIYVMNEEGTSIDWFPAREYPFMRDQIAAVQKEYPGIKELGE
jgi:hypothetical protein